MLIEVYGDMTRIAKATSQQREFEGMLAEQLKDLTAEKAKVDNLVSKMLPRSIVEDLKAGKDVTAESFEEATILFSGVWGLGRGLEKSGRIHLSPTRRHCWLYKDCQREHTTAGGGDAQHALLAL